VGDDPEGAAALALLEAEGVETAQVRRVPGVATGVGFILVDAQGHNAIAVDLGANRSLSPADLDRAEPLIATADVVLAQLEIAPETALYALRLARRHGVRALLNPAPAVPLAAADLALVDVLSPNLSEARLLAGLPAGEPAALATALWRAGVATVVVTLGEEGALLRDQSGAMPVPAYYEADAQDTTGAGDAFSAALAVALGEGRALPEAVDFACAAGAYSVRSPGTVPSYATRATLEEFIRRRVANR
jgi:ribokinase